MKKSLLGYGFICMVLPALIMLGIFFSGCGDTSTTVSTSQDQENNQNQNSQNGELNCSSSCTPAVEDGVVGFEVFTECDGSPFEGPAFAAVAPTNCVLAPGGPEA